VIIQEIYPEPQTNNIRYEFTTHTTTPVNLCVTTWRKGLQILASPTLCGDAKIGEGEELSIIDFEISAQWM